VDIGSRIDGFVTHVASFRRIEVFDIRPLSVKLPNIDFKSVDFMDAQKEQYTGYCDSLSCLHVIEHFGLGRYGDPIDYYGHLKGLDNLHRILKKGGVLYFSTPIGPQRVEFNAHRVFSIHYLLDLFKGKFDLECFSYVNDKGTLFEDISLTQNLISDNCGCKYGCGIFELRKI